MIKGENAKMFYGGIPIGSVKTWKMEGFTIPTAEGLSEVNPPQSVTFDAYYPNPIYFDFKVGQIYPFKDKTGLQGEAECIKREDNVATFKIIKIG